MNTEQKEYNPKEIEPKWQEYWEEKKLFEAADSASEQKWYTLVEFPYPSGVGLHVGHVRSYTALDIVSRKKRMQGWNVLYPIGWDAFGLPTENYAIKNKIHPRVATEENIANFKRQLKSLGLSFDWSREVNTTDPEYYKWTQWIFLQLYKEGLAYQDKIPINWCPSCKIGLANEEVIEGKCERCGTETTQRLMKQWMLAITKYADRLIDDLDAVDYLKKIAVQQVNWIGRSEGINLFYPVEIDGKKTKYVIETFTKFPETNFGATFIVISPEHPIVDAITTEGNKKAVQRYREEAAKRTDIERATVDKEKTGVCTGAYGLNRLTGEQMPIWVADFVLAHFGTGCVVGVPAHDVRDWQFAQKYNLPIRRVVTGTDGDESPVESLDQVIEEGTMINSGFLDGLDAQTEAKEKIKEYMEEKGWGKLTTTYSLRDWVFSRQHYWGEPIPIIHCPQCGTVSVPEDQLPVELPDVENYEPTDTGESPLAAMTDWVNTTCPQCGAQAKRETDTMPNWAGSSWYFMRYTDPRNDNEIAAQKRLKYWLPVDLYNGGMEHTTLHLLYSRFWYKFLFDIGVAPQPEPYARRRSHGMILAHDGKKMSKSFGNVVNPDDIVDQFGADTLRLYEMFMGPFDEAIAWDESATKGMRKFLNRIWRLQLKVIDNTENKNLSHVVHQTIKKVTEDIDAMKFNTAVAQMMICVNACEKEDTIPEHLFELLVTVLSPFAPHIAEEMWENLGHTESISQQEWPVWDESLVVEDTITIAVQVNGKVRDTIQIQPNAPEQQVLKIALASQNIQKHITGKNVVKQIYVPGRIVSIVVK